MPYIAVNTAQKIPAAVKEKLKKELGRLIAIIPTKTEAGLMVDFSDGRTIYKAGKEADGAFIDLRLFHKSDYEPQKKFTEECFELFVRELGLKQENIYITIMEFDSWGTAGTLKQ